RLNPPGNPISNSRCPRSDPFQGPKPRRYADHYATKQRRGTCGLIGFRRIRTWVAPAPVRADPPTHPISTDRSEGPNGFRLVLPKQRPAAPTKAFLAQRAAFFAVRSAACRHPSGVAIGHRSLGRGGWAIGEAALALANCPATATNGCEKGRRPCR